MGTNYYVVKNVCECCHRYDIQYHIGKSSWGWSFTFQGYKYDNLTSWKQWKEFLKPEIIKDEYGDRIHWIDFVKMVENEKSPNYVRDDGHKNLQHNEEGKKTPWPTFNPEYDWTDEDGYAFTSRDFS
jgi:hypothetical protein